MSTEQQTKSRWQTFSPRAADPGDLGRRVARRRAELRLTRERAAERAGMSARYLEYLERSPARPTTAALQRLAAALDTTPAALLGGAADPLCAGGRPGGQAALRALTRGECRRLLAPGGTGRMAFPAAAGPAVCPATFALARDAVVVRAVAAAVAGACSAARVAFEADHIDEVSCAGWSVVVRGEARRVRGPAELRALRGEAEAWPWAGRDGKYVLVALSDVSGRRLPAS